MRVTAEKKAETRERIIESARKLFINKGFEETTTRDITVEAGIAAGTLFNYFPTKEALAQELLAEALKQADAEFSRRRPAATLDESLFSYLAGGLRHLRPYRHMIPAVLEAAFTPLKEPETRSPGDDVRLRHLDTVRGLMREKAANNGAEPSVITLHMYWSLYLGILSFWSHDESPKQEDTLALIDQATRLFVSSLAPAAAHKEITHDPQYS